MLFKSLIYIYIYILCVDKSDNINIGVDKSEDIKQQNNNKQTAYAYICCSRISNLWPVYKPFNWIVSWLAGFKTGPVYAKLKSG